MGDVLKPVGQWIAGNIPLSVGIGLFIFCLLFEISKIKIYPLKWLWKAISWPLKKIDEQRTESFKNLMNGLKTDLDSRLIEMQNGTNKNCEVVQENFKKLETRFNELDARFDKLDAKQIETDERLDKLAASRIKNHVLNFARQCRKGEDHSHEDYANLFKENKEYELLVEKHGWENDVYFHDFAYIKTQYDAGKFYQ